MNSELDGVVLEVEAVVLLVEDDPICAEVISACLSRSVGVHNVETLAAAREFLETPHNLGGVVVDLDLPDGHGLDLVTGIRKTKILLPIMVLTAHNEPAFINRAQELGAEFVCKPPTRANLESFARRVIAEDYIDEAWMERVLDYAGSTWGLSPLEARAVSLALAGSPRSALAERLYVTENTVKTVVRRILRKSGETSLDRLVNALLRHALTSP